MHRFFSALPLFLAVGALLAGCSRDPSAASPVASALVATSAGGHESVVVRTDETDQNADGVIDSRVILTTRYDVHGNAIVETQETSRFGAVINRWSGTNQYNNHNDLTGYVLDADQNGDGAVDERERLSTLATDQQGHPLRQAFSLDSGADGTVDFAAEVSNQFDARGRLIAQVRGSQADAYQYDEHDNVFRHVMHWAQSRRIIDLLYTSEFSVHNVEVSSASTVTQTNQPPLGHTMTSIAFDAQGYPTLQDVVWKSGDRISNHETIETTYDDHHRILLQVASEDRNQDGRIDSRATRRFDYQGPELAPVHAWAGARAADRTGASALVASGEKGPDGPSGGRFTE